MCHAAGVQSADNSLTGFATQMQEPAWDRRGFSGHVLRDTEARARKLQDVQNELRDETTELQHASDYFKTLKRDI